MWYNKAKKERKAQSGNKNNKESERKKLRKNGLGMSKEKDENKGGKKFPTVQLSDYIGGLMIS